MKKLAYLFVLFSVCLAFAGCGRPGPRAVAEKFTAALAAGDVKEAKKYCTESTGQILDMANSMGGIKKQPDARFEFVGEEINGDQATVRFKNKDGSTEPMNLVREGGVWKVSIQK